MNADSRIERAVAGDADALDELLREATPSLRAQLSIDNKWNRSFDVDDVLQVTYLEAFLRIRSLERATLSAFQTWLRRIAEHNLIDAIRALERHKRPDARDRVTSGSAGESARTLLAKVAGSEATAGSRAAVNELLARMRGAIDELPASYRAVIELVELEQHSVADAARRLNKSPGAVHMLRSRARDRLQEVLLRR